MLFLSRHSAPGDMMDTKAKELGPVKNTARGFEIVEFVDRYGHKCSLQQSSCADSDVPGASCVWLGPSSAEPIVMASQAASVGVKTNVTEGWVPYPIPEQVSLNTRAHLGEEQVKALIVSLQRWVDTGSFTKGSEEG
jgi:hypothetical protein